MQTTKKERKKYSQTGLAAWWWTESKVGVWGSWCRGGLRIDYSTSPPEQSSPVSSALSTSHLSPAANAASTVYRIRMLRQLCPGSHWGPCPFRLTDCSQRSAVAGPKLEAVRHRSAGMVRNEDLLDLRGIYTQILGPRKVLPPQGLHTVNENEF